VPEKFQDLAKRWLTAKRTELLTGNRREREDAEAESADARRAMSDEVVNRAARAAVPGLATWQDNQAATSAAREAAAVESARAEILALPRATVDISVIGPWGTASWQGELPARAERERDDDTGEVTLRVALETVDELAPELAGQRLYALRAELRPYHGPDRYNPAKLGGEPDPMAYTVEYGYRDEGFFWSPELGPGMVEVTDGEQQLDLGLPMQGASGDLRVTATINLPPIRDPQAEERAAEARQRRAFFATLPKAAVQLAVTGPAATGTWAGELAAMVSQERDDGTGGTTLQVALAPADDPGPQLAGRPLLGLRLEVPRYAGPGQYFLASRTELEPDSNLLVLGDEQEPFAWAPGLGPGTVSVGADGQTVDVVLAMRGPAGELQLTATVRLPEPLTAG
jgi:hypothetical protein